MLKESSFHPFVGDFRDFCRARGGVVVMQPAYITHHHRGSLLKFNIHSSTAAYCVPRAGCIPMPRVAPYSVPGTASGTRSGRDGQDCYRQNAETIPIYT